MRILKMLEDGKINADEAARLLEAVKSSSPPYGSRRRHRIINGLEHIPEIIAAKINGSFKHACVKTTKTFPSKEKIVFKGISGDLKVLGKAEDTITVEQDGFVKTSEEANALVLKGLGGDVKISTPHKTDVTVKGVSGNIAVEDIDGSLLVKSVSGDIHTQNLKGDFQGAFVSGEVRLDYENLKNIEISAKAANITLSMSKKTEASILIETLDGDIKCDFALKDEEKTDHTLKGTLNKATSTISIRNEHGDVHLVKRD
ncbi:MAG: DUF4097 family beta strand repeat protein [candidate division WOR-3 bacterium]|nr:MAG: DUF4097 family beta strand repeat protein [candidate division WOR-3 bacterium]